MVRSKKLKIRTMAKVIKVRLKPIKFEMKLPRVKSPKSRKRR